MVKLSNIKNFLLDLTIWILQWCGLIQITRLSDKGRATQWVENLEPKIRKKWIRRKLFPPVIFALNTVEPPSPALLSLYARQVFLVDPPSSEKSGLMRRMFKGDASLPSHAPYRILRRPGESLEMRTWVAKSDNSRSAVKRLLEKMNLDPDKEFVLFSTREASYYEYLNARVGVDSGSETLPETYIRNPEINTYLDVCTSLKSHGYQVIRFGISTEPLPEEFDGIVFDYSIHCRSPEGDLLLGQYCRALMSGASGAWCFASLHNRPVVFTNTYVPFLAGVSHRDRFIPRLLLNEETGQFLTFREMRATRGQYSYAQNCLRDGIKLVGNSPTEILEVTLELLGLDEELLKRNTVDETLRNKFEAIRFSGVTSSQDHAYSRAGIGTRFLRRYSQLLD